MHLLTADKAEAALLPLFYVQTLLFQTSDKESSRGILDTTGDWATLTQPFSSPHKALHAVGHLLTHT